MTKIKFSFIPTGSNNFSSDAPFEELVDTDNLEKSIFNIFKDKYNDISNFESHITYGQRLVISTKFKVHWSDYDGNKREGNEEWDVYVVKGRHESWQVK